MKYFREIYACIYEQIKTIAESRDEGIEFRLGGRFFYNPKTRAYDLDLVERHLYARERLDELYMYGQTEKKKYFVQGALAVILHALLHPKNVYKIDCQVQGK